MRVNELTHQIIGAAIEVHRELGPGKPEAAYEAALAHELRLRGLAHCVQKPVPVVYKGLKLDCGYRLDVLVEGTAVVEVKAIEIVIPVHRAQVLTYLKVGGWKVALLLNFNVVRLKEGIERIVLGFERSGDKPPAEEQRAEPARTTTDTTPLFYSETDSGHTESERLATQTIAAAVEVYQELGPGLLLSTYEACLCHELYLRGVAFDRKRSLTLSYKGVPLPASDEIEVLVGGRVAVRPHALTAIQPVNEAAVLSQLRLGGWKLGLLLNFNTTRFAEGVRRIVLSQATPEVA